MLAGCQVTPGLTPPGQGAVSSSPVSAAGHGPVKSAVTRSAGEPAPWSLGQISLLTFRALQVNVTRPGASPCGFYMRDTRTAIVVWYITDGKNVGKSTFTIIACIIMPSQHFFT